MNISTLDDTDLEECAGLYVTVFNAEPWKENLDKNMALQRLSHLIALPNKVGKKCVIEKDIVGFWIGYIEPLADFKRLFIKEVLVHPELQNQGINKQLMKSVDEHARFENCKNISLLTNLGMNAYFFYKKLGYESHNEVVLMEKKM